MARDRRWFEFADLRGRSTDRAVWIPLRAFHKTISDEDEYADGHEEEHFAAASACFAVGQRDLVTKTVSWSSLSLMNDQAPYVQDGRYVPADVYGGDSDSLRGTYLVLSQQGNALESGEWIIHPDLILSLQLKREGDTWVAMNEGYESVIRLHRKATGSPSLVEIRANYLKDFLAAREEVLCVSTYRSREAISFERPAFNWDNDAAEVKIGNTRWMRSIREINERGQEYGGTFAVFHVGRKNFDLHQDVPSVDHSDEFTTRQLEGKFGGSLRYRIWGEQWNVELVEPAPHSTRIRNDKVPSSIFFFTDASGKRESADTLDTGGRWLWFRPDVINKALEFRGSHLEWYTGETGTVRMGPDSGVVFGVNSLGLVNVYAKDIGFSAIWQQQLWAGFNLVPEGGVSKELLLAQAEGEPANTRAPESLFGETITQVNERFMRRFGFSLIRPHKDYPRINRSVHRFRATGETGIFELAKDLTRLTADSFDIAGLQKLQPERPGEKRGSLKSLEAVIALSLGNDHARQVMAPLFGIYDLRLADAHLPGSGLAEAFSNIGIDRGKPGVIQGAQMIFSVARAFHLIAKAIEP